MTYCFFLRVGFFYGYGSLGEQGLQVVETAIVASHCFCRGKLESSGGVPKCVVAYIFETCPLKFRKETGLKGVCLTKCC